MRKIKLALLGSILAMSFAACGGGGGVGEVEAIAKEACACKDMDCYDAVNTKFRALGKKLEEENKGKIPENLKKAGKKAQTQMRECRKKLREAEKTE